MRLILAPVISKNGFSASWTALAIYGPVCVVTLRVTPEKRFRSLPANASSGPRPAPKPAAPPAMAAIFRKSRRRMFPPSSSQMMQ